ncbi:hypothetical protein E2C01_066480 [Portunus trituberculatus]|uniref:Uncharacterized protein n=1 Tax=Portunus trituberculatus TaxID=210409 RepID=A0A5B7HPW5_PORTR|nr:hypothetical protein [Portunus trituberculatus]
MNIRKHMKPFTPKWRGTSHVPRATCHATRESDLPIKIQMYPECLPFSSSAGDYSTYHSNNNLLIRSCLLAHWEVNCHPETRGNVLSWSEITVPLVTCHLSPAICHVQRATLV